MRINTYPTYPSFQADWLALAIGNSRLHWAYFQADRLWETGHAPHLAPSEAPDLSFLPEGLPHEPELWLASVVPPQTVHWQSCSPHVITLDQISVKNLYPTLGIDRALALLAAGERWGWPALVVDGGTALTLTGADGDRHLVGGAILPGLGLQLRSLATQTAQLPQLSPPVDLPPRWARTTEQAIQSGILYSLLAGLQDFLEAWWQQFPAATVVFTGGDGAELLNLLRKQNSDWTDRIHFEPNLVFFGMQIARMEILQNR